MSIAAVRLLSFYTVAWLEINNDLRSLMRGVTFVDQTLKHTNVKLESFLEQLTAKYENSDELLLELSVSRHVNPVLDTIQKNVNDAVAEGRNAQHCHDKAVINSLEFSNTEFKKMIPCLNAFHTEYERNFNYTVDIIVDIQMTRENVNGIIRGCHESEDVKECVRSKVTVANQLAEEYQRKASSLETDVHENYSNALSDAINCISVGEHALENAMVRVKQIADKCLRK